MFQEVNVKYSADHGGSLCPSMDILCTQSSLMHTMLDGLSVDRTNQFTVKNIPLEEVLAFRALNANGLWSSADKWDRSGDHIGFFLDNQLQGVVRINRVMEAKLPLSDAFPDFIPENDDMQIGRLIIAIEARATRVVLCAAKTLQTIVSAHTGRVIATPLAQDEGGLSEKTFTRRGFGRIYEPFSSHDHRTLIPMIRDVQCSRTFPSLELEFYK